MRRIASLVVLGLFWISMAFASLPPTRNFAVVTASQGYDSVATSIVLSGGDGAKLPSPSTEGAFYLVWWNVTDFATPSSDPNREIIKVTARSTDTLTIVRGQDGTTAVNHNTSGKTYRLALAFVAAMYNSIQTELNTLTGAIPNVSDCSSYASCNALVAAIGGSALHTARVSNQQTIASNLGWTSNYSVWLIGAGQLSISSSVVVTFDRPDQLIADRFKQIFAGAGSPTGVTFSRPGTVYPQWWGAKADGSTDDGPELQSAHDSLPAAGGVIELAAGTYKSNQEIVISKSDVTVRLAAGAKLDCSTIGGGGTSGVHGSANVLGCMKITGARVRIVGGQITGTADVSGTKVIGLWIAGASQTKVGGTKITSCHAGVWAGGNAVEPTLQNVELASNEHNVMLGYQPTTSSSPQVSRAALLNLNSHNATVGDGLTLYSYTSDTHVAGGYFYSNAGDGIDGYVGGGDLTISGALSFSNAGAGLSLTYNSLSGTASNKLGFAKKLTIIGNTFRANTGDGVTIKLADYAQFSTIGGVEDVALIGNLSESNGSEGYDLGLVRSIVSGNRALTNTLDGFTVRSSKTVELRGNQSWDNGTAGDNRTGFLFATADTTGATPPNSTLISLIGNQAGDTRSGGSRTVNYAYNLNKLDTGEVMGNHADNANTAGWLNINQTTAVSYWNNSGTVSGSDVLGASVKKHLRGTATYDPPSMASGDYATTTVSVAGAAVGEPCTASHATLPNAAWHLTCHVSSANTVTAVLRNATAGTVDLGSGTLAVEVWKP